MSLITVELTNWHQWKVNDFCGEYRVLEILDSREIECTVTIAISVSNNDLERAGEQSCSHLQKNERLLFNTSLDDAAFQRKDG